MKRVRFGKAAAAAAALVGLLVMAGCRGDRQPGETATYSGKVTVAAGVGLPDKMKLKNLWDLDIKKGQVKKAWVKDGYVMVAAERPNILYLLRKQDGMNVWNCQFKKPIETRYPPAVSKDAVMTVSDERIVRVHRAFGQIICILDPGIPISARPVLRTWVETEKGTPVIFASSYADGRLWALKIRKTVREMQASVHGDAPVKILRYATSRGWSTAAPRGGGHILAPLSSAGGFIYVCTTNGYVMAVKDTDGRPAWRLQTQGAVEKGVCLNKDRLYFGCSDFKLYCLDRLSGEKLWELPTGSEVTARPLADPDPRVGLVVSISEGQGLLGVETKKGRKIWQNKDVKQILGIGEKAVYVLSRKGRLLGLDKKTGKALWQSSLGGFKAIFPNEEQFEKAGQPLYLLALTKRNEIVCLVEPDFNPKALRTGKPKKDKPKIPVIRGSGTPAAPAAPAKGPAPKKND